MEEENDEGKFNLNISISADRDLFARRSCPKCGLILKFQQTTMI